MSGALRKQTGAPNGAGRQSAPAASSAVSSQGRSESANLYMYSGPSTCQPSMDVSMTSVSEWRLTDVTRVHQQKKRKMEKKVEMEIQMEKDEGKNLTDEMSLKPEP